MKVVILGGYGVFGSRLGELLRRDNHEVYIAGRSLNKATMAAVRIGAKPLVVDLRADFSAIFAVKPQVVIDAAGPFQSYTDNPYAVAQRCIELGVDYLDLSDDASFTLGISELDETATKAKCRVLSGASSVPGLSSIIISELVREMTEVLLIDTTILPGNRAPRGQSVIESIIGQVGRPTKVWRGGQWQSISGWSEHRRYKLPKGLVRSAYFVEVPDIRLFPKIFMARSVIFRAGMELEIMNKGLACLSGLVRLTNMQATSRLAQILRIMAHGLLPFGTDKGGMRVAVTGKHEGSIKQRIWTLVANSGEGPFVPAIVCRALLRRHSEIPIGARPCIAELNLLEVEEAMSDLAIEINAEQRPRPTLFQAALQDRWDLLPPEVHELHSVQDMESFSGKAKVTRGTSLVARFAAWFFNFPKAGDNVPITITKTRTPKGEIWERNFAGRIFRSYCTPSDKVYRYNERFWFFKYEQELPVEDGTMFLPVKRGWFLGIPLPRFFLPGSNSREFSHEGIFNFDVSLIAPFGGGLIVRYQGALTPDRKSYIEN